MFFMADLLDHLALENARPAWCCAIAGRDTLVAQWPAPAHPQCYGVSDPKALFGRATTGTVTPTTNPPEGERRR